MVGRRRKFFTLPKTVLNAIFLPFYLRARLDETRSELKPV